MLTTLDVLIGFTVVMLILSMPVTMLTQMLLSISNLRGVALQKGVVSLLGLLHPNFAGAGRGNASQVATALLTHPLVESPRWLAWWPRAASAVHREELVKLILHAAIPESALAVANANIARAQSTLAILKTPTKPTGFWAGITAWLHKRVAPLADRIAAAEDALATATAAKPAIESRLRTAEAAKSTAQGKLDAANTGLAAAKTAEDTARAAEAALAADAGEGAKATARSTVTTAETARKDCADAVTSAQADLDAAIKALASASADTSTALPGALYPILADLGIPDPKATLEAVRMAQLALERQSPELANDVRASIALLDTASSQFLAKINGWFDQSMDRVSELFTLYSRLVTAVMALLVALIFQLDSVSLINRLSSDSKTRDALVQSAIDHPGRYNPVSDPAETTKAKTEVASAKTDFEHKSDAAKAAKLATDAKPEAVAAAVAAADAAELYLAHAQARLARLEGADAIKAARDTADAAAKTATEAKSKADAAPADTALKAASDKAQAAADTAKTAATEAAAKVLTPEAVIAQIQNDPGMADLVKLKLVEMPTSLDDWWQRLQWRHALGIFVSAALLSLGGPFWFALLGNLLKLRPQLAKKDDDQREARQTTQKPAADGAKPDIAKAGGAKP